MDEPAPLALAARLCVEAGRPAPRALERLAGGKNNRVYRVEDEAGGTCVLKLYFHDPLDTRDRLTAEWRFLNHACVRGVRVVPEPLAQAPDEHAALYTFLPGRKLDQPHAGHVAATLDFIAATNAEPHDLSALPAGSEACFSVAQHVARVDARMARLENLAEDAPYRESAARLVAYNLRPAWAEVRSRILNSSGADPNRALAPDQIIASPSDLGFHNALLDEGGTLRFLDFEYAGQDDAAKLCGDFFCCPEIPAPIDQFEPFVTGLCTRLGLGEQTALRARMLLDAYRIKWTCIILNDFLPAGNSRRTFALSTAREGRCARQLEKAKSTLSQIGSY